MIAIAVDDESWALKTLTEAITQSGVVQTTHSFSSCTSALEWAAEHPFDVAFLDINMRGMGGLELAKRLRNLHPECLIFFCTGFQEYALEAFQLHADGYLMKPVSSEKIREEIRYRVRGNKKNKYKIHVRSFGGFEVLDADGQNLRFKRSKTKELLALLVDRKGMGITARDICAILWEDDAEQDKKNMQYLWNLFSDLSKTLKDADAEDVLVHSGSEYMLDTSKVDSDLYAFIKGTDRSADVESYLPQYSWAEPTMAYLLRL